MPITAIHMDQVREYDDGSAVHLVISDDVDRFVIYATNESGSNITSVDLVHVLLWLNEKSNDPDYSEVFEKIKQDYNNGIANRNKG